MLVLVAYYPCVVSLVTEPDGGMIRIPGTKLSKCKEFTDLSSWTVSAPFDAKLDIEHDAESTAFATLSFNTSTMLPSAVKGSAEVAAWKDALVKRPVGDEVV